MKRRKRNIAREIIDDLNELNATLEAGIPLHEKYTVRTAHVVPEPGKYAAADVQRTRELAYASIHSQIKYLPDGAQVVIKTKL